MARPISNGIDHIVDTASGYPTLAAAVIKWAIMQRARRWLREDTPGFAFWGGIAGLPLEEVRRLDARHRGQG